MKNVRRMPYSLFQKCEQKYYKHFSPLGNILIFHQVNNDKSCWEDIGCSISGRSFDRIISSSTNFAGIPDFFKKKIINRIFITFDDAYDDVYQIAFPILERHSIPFAIFVSPGLIDSGKFLTRRHLNELCKSPLCTVGAHSVSHKMLRWVSADEARNEIEESKKILEDIMSKKVEYFAYPYGSRYACSKKNIEQVRQAGFEAAFSTINCALNEKTIKNKWFLPRINVNEHNSPEILRLICDEQD